MTAFAIRRLAAPDAVAYRDLRLEGLRDHPEAFSASWEEEGAHPLDWFAQRLADHSVVGGWSAERELLGVVGLLVPTTPKLRHKGALWGVFVRPEARGTGLAAALLARTIADAAGLVQAIRLTVAASNQPAIRLYEKAGFRAFGREPRALRVADDYHDELLMELVLTPRG